MAKKRQNRIVSLVLCAAVVLATVLTPNVSYAAEEADLISQGLVTYENHTDVANYRGETKTAPDAPEGKVFAGWYKEEGGEYKALNATAADAAETAYAKFVDANVFDAKFQLTADTTNVSAKTNIRLITTVDTVNYATVGFNVTFGTKTLYCGSEKVYAQINAFVDETANPIQPTVFSNASTYFVAHSIKNVTNNAFNSDFTIVPTWTTIDGTVVEATGDATMTFHVNEYADEYPYDMENGVTFENAGDLYYMTPYNSTVVREEYEGSYRLRMNSVASGTQEPGVTVNFGQTYPAGSKLTFNVKAVDCGPTSAYQTVAVAGQYVSFPRETWKTMTVNLANETSSVYIYHTVWNTNSTLYLDDFQILIPIDLEEGLDFETASSMQYVSTESGDKQAVMSRVEYEGSTRLAVTRNAAGYPTIRLNLGKTYEAGTTVTFWMKLASTNTGELVVSGLNQEQQSEVSADKYVQGNFEYEARTITLNAPCDEIRLQYNTMWNSSETLYYDNFLVIPNITE